LLHPTEQQAFAKFLFQVPVFKDVMKEIGREGPEFIKFWYALSITQYDKGAFIYQKRDHIDSVFILIKGEVCQIGQQVLDLDETLDRPLKTLKDFMALYIRYKLCSKVSDIFVRTQIEKLLEKNKNSQAYSMINNIKFLSKPKKCQVKLDDQ